MCTCLHLKARDIQWVLQSQPHDSVTVVREKNMVMGPAVLGSKNGCAGGGLWKFTRNRQVGSAGPHVLV
jgi:hypothetical protein